MTSFNCIVFGKRFWNYQKPYLESAFLKSWKCFSHRRDSAKQYPNGVHLILSILLCIEKGVWYFKLSAEIRFFYIFWKCFTPEWTLRKHNPMGSIWYSFHLSVAWWRVFNTFNLQTEIRLFEILKIFYCCIYRYLVRYL